MKLLTAELLKVLPPLRGQENAGWEAIAHAKFFTPDSNWTWYATEYDPVDRMFFGLVSGFEEEMGYFSLEELEKATGPMGLHIERDLYWKPKKLTEFSELAKRIHGEYLLDHQNH